MTDQKPPTQKVNPKVLDGMDLTVFEDLEVAQVVVPVINVDEDGKTYAPVRSSLVSYQGASAPVGRYDSAGKLETTGGLNPDEVFNVEGAGTTDGAGTLGATALMASAGAGLKWFFEDLTVQFNLPVLAGTQVVGSDGLSRLCVGYQKLGLTQGTANTAVTFQVSGGPLNCDVVIRGRARKVV